MTKQEELLKWNDEQGREDTMYYIEFREYREGVNHNLIEKDGDSCLECFNDKEKALKYFNSAKERFDNDTKHYKLDLMEFIGVYSNNAEYESILHHEKGM